MSRGFRLIPTKILINILQKVLPGNHYFVFFIKTNLDSFCRKNYILDTLSFFLGEFLQMPVVLSKELLHVLAHFTETYRSILYFFKVHYSLFFPVILHSSS